MLVNDHEPQLHEQGWEIIHMFENLFFPSATYITENPLSPLR